MLFWKKFNKKIKKIFLFKNNFFKKKYNEIYEKYFKELKKTLILSDFSYKITETIINEILNELKFKKQIKINDINNIIFNKIFSIYTNNNLVSTKLNFSDNNISIFLIVGVNGSGKTTSVAKLAYKLKLQGKKPFLIGSDTFKDSGIEQLKIWAEKINVDYYLGKNKQDPASVVYNGIQAAKKKFSNVIIIDTAGRLENKINLINELKKINKIINQKLKYKTNEILLVIDSETGQNAINQAREFKKNIDLTGIILTKIDGTAKGGSIFNIKNELNIPVKLICFGEKISDLESFNLNKYIFNLTNELFNNYKKYYI